MAGGPDIHAAKVPQEQTGAPRAATSPAAGIDQKPVQPDAPERRTPGAPVAPKLHSERVSGLDQGGNGTAGKLQPTGPGRGLPGRERPPAQVAERPQEPTEQTARKDGGLALEQEEQEGARPQADGSAAVRVGSDSARIGKDEVELAPQRADETEAGERRAQPMAVKVEKVTLATATAPLPTPPTDDVDETVHITQQDGASVESAVPEAASLVQEDGLDRSGSESGGVTLVDERGAVSDLPDLPDSAHAASSLTDEPKLVEATEIVPTQTFGDLIPKETSDSLDKINFQVEKEVEVSDEEVQAAMRGIALVWNRYIGEQTDLTIRFTTELADATGKVTTWFASYDPDLNRISFAMDRIREINIGSSDEARMLFFGAYEGARKVQFHIGDGAPSSTDLVGEQYANGRHQVESSTEAIHVLKHAYPDLAGGITQGGNWYRLPDISKYDFVIQAVSESATEVKDATRPSADVPVGAETEPEFNLDGYKAQARIIRGLFTGEGLSIDNSQSAIEGHYRNLLAKQSQKARDEIRQLMGLSAEEITPLDGSQEMVLGPEAKDKVIDYFLDIFKINAMAQSAKDRDDLRGLELSSFINSRMRALQDETTIHLIGPVLQFRFQTDQAFQLFNLVATGGNAKAAFIPLPLPAQSGEQVQFSQDVLVNFVSEEGDVMIGQNPHHHEMWHAIDALREIMSRQLRNPEQSTHAIDRPEVLVRATVNSKYKDRLDQYFFDSENFADQLQQLQALAPEMYRFYSGLDPTATRSITDDNSQTQRVIVTDFERSFFSIQDELSAYIAGYLNGDNGDHINIERRQAIVDKIVKGYTPFGQINLDNLQWAATQDQTGRWKVDETKVESMFNPLIASIGDPDPNWKAMLAKYSEKDPVWSFKRVNIDRETYTRDFQQMLDFFINQGGAGYEAQERMRANIGRSIDAYSRLAAYREDPYVALVEISLLPISHWELYAQRKEQGGPADHVLKETVAITLPVSTESTEQRGTEPAVNHDTARRRSKDSRIDRLGSRSIYDYPAELRETLRKITNVQSFEELIETVFQEQGDLTVLDLASGAGEFPLLLAKQAQELGIAKVVATDIDLTRMEANMPELNSLGVETRVLDVNTVTNPDETFDIVTINAPVVQGEHAFAYQAIEAALAYVKKPGLILLRYHPSGEEAMLEPKSVVPSNFPLFCFSSLDGYPRSGFTTYLGGARKGESSNLYVIVNIPSPDGLASEIAITGPVG